MFSWTSHVSSSLMSKGTGKAMNYTEWELNYEELFEQITNNYDIKW